MYSVLDVVLTSSYQDGSWLKSEFEIAKDVECWPYSRARWRWWQSRCVWPCQKMLIPTPCDFLMIHKNSSSSWICWNVDRSNESTGFVNCTFMKNWLFLMKCLCVLCLCQCVIVNWFKGIRLNLLDLIEKIVLWQ